MEFFRQLKYSPVFWYIVLTLCLFTILSLSSCAAKKHTITEDHKTEIELNIKEDTQTKVKNITDSVYYNVDTTKKNTKELNIKDIIISYVIYDSTGNIKSNRETKYKETKLYISDEDLYMIKYGILKDSTELAKDYNKTIDKDSINKKSTTDKYKSDGGKFVWSWWWLLFFILILIIGYLFKKFKS